MLQNFPVSCKKNKNAKVRQTVSLSSVWLPSKSGRSVRVRRRIDRLTVCRTADRFFELYAGDTEFFLRNLPSMLQNPPDLGKKNKKMCEARRRRESGSRRAAMNNGMRRMNSVRDRFSRFALDDGRDIRAPGVQIRGFRVDPFYPWLLSARAGPVPRQAHGGVTMRASRPRSQ